MSKNLIQDILKIINSKIFCIGDIMLDKYVIGKSQRISPEGPIPILDTQQEINMLGGVGNVVRNLSTIGAQVSIVSLIGDDDPGFEIEKKINQKNIFKKILKDKSRPSIVKTRFIANNQQILRVDYEKVKPVTTVLEKKILRYSKKMILNSGAIVLSDYGKGLLTNKIISYLINFANTNKKPVVVDPKNENFEKYKGATIITPNINELQLAVKEVLKNENSIIHACRQLIKKYSFKHILVTRGKDGMILVSKDKNKVLKLKTEAKNIYDVSGAGDTVVSFISACLASSISLDNAVKIANFAAGVVVSKPGTSVAHLSELILSLNKSDSNSSKIVKTDEAEKIVKFWKEKKETIGFTNGCFDYLHPGHLSLFQQAKKKCSKLVVALNSDISVKKNKGPTRPKQNEFLRKKILQSIDYVDLIIVFSDKTPFELIKKITPSLLVKGADYKESEIVGAKYVKKNGGKILRATTLGDFSSSLIIEEILNSSF